MLTQCDRGLPCGACKSRGNTDCDWSNAKRIEPGPTTLQGDDGQNVSTTPVAGPSTYITLDQAGGTAGLPSGGPWSLGDSIVQASGPIQDFTAPPAPYNEAFASLPTDFRMQAGCFLDDLIHEIPVGTVTILRRVLDSATSASNVPATAHDWLIVSLIFAMIGLVQASGRSLEEYKILPVSYSLEAAARNSMLASHSALARAKAFSDWHALPVDIITIQVLLLHYSYKRFRQPLAAGR